MQTRGNQAEAWTIEDWLDERIGIATRFVYSEFRVGAGKQIDQPVLSQLVMQLARRQFGINSASAKLAPVAPECCFKPVAPSQARCCLFGRRFLERGRYCCCDQLPPC
jgi:glutathione S-transferase